MARSGSPTAFRASLTKPTISGGLGEGDQVEQRLVEVEGPAFRHHQRPVGTERGDEIGVMADQNYGPLVLLVAPAATLTLAWGSRLLVGSSRRRTLGPPSTTIARASLVFSPPDKCCCILIDLVGQKEVAKHGAKSLVGVVRDGANVVEDCDAGLDLLVFLGVIAKRGVVTETHLAQIGRSRPRPESAEGWSCPPR